MREAIIKILEMAVNAPSGDNSQPWKFAIRNDSLDILNVPDADRTLYNFLQRGSFVGHGALLENLTIVAAAQGFRATVNLFPVKAKPDLVATVTFGKGISRAEPLYPAILKRCTNRLAYKKQPLQENHLQKILSSALPEGVRLLLLTDIQKISLLGRGLSLNERLILENYEIHRGIFSYIRWTKEEEEQKKNGLFIKTLCLAPPQEFAFKLFRNWPLINILSKLGVAKLVAKDSAKLYQTSAAFGLLLAKGEDDTDFIAVGRALQRIWLSATTLGISLQPTAALLYLNQRLLKGEDQEFTAEQIALIKKVNLQIKDLFEATHGVPAMMFRLGYAGEPPARSMKKPPVISPV